MGNDLAKDRGASALERCWYALYTRPRFERKVHARLVQKQVKAFLPEREVTHTWSNNRVRKIKEPLFPSYIFVNATAVERYHSICTPGVAYIVGIRGKPTCIPDDQIESIYRILRHGYDPEPYEYFESGDEVMITYGPLKGLKGICVQERSLTKLVVSVNLIHQAVAVTIERTQLRKIATRKASLV
jgi:transcription antitermination factor NusG